METVDNDYERLRDLVYTQLGSTEILQLSKQEAVENCFFMINTLLSVLAQVGSENVDRILPAIATSYTGLVSGKEDIITAFYSGKH